MPRILVFVGACFAMVSQAGADPKLYTDVAAAVKAVTAKVDLVPEMKKVLVRLRLMDDKGGYTVAALSGKGLTAPVDVPAFIDRVVGCAAQNGYLNAFMRAIKGQTFKLSTMTDKIAVIIGSTAYTVVLDRLTKAMRDDWKLLSALHTHWKSQKGLIDNLKVLNPFEVAKVYSIQLAIDSYLKDFAAGKTSPTGGREGVALNIIEAVLEDLRLGFPDNSKAGITMALLPPGTVTAPNPKTGAEPSHFSKDGNALVYSPHLPRLWADLYSTWNMSFVSHYPNFPYFLGKLLTPQVLCYQGTPNLYLYNRVMALYAHIQFEVFTRLDRKAGKPGTEQIEWADANLTKAWAKANLEAAKNYEAELNKLDPPLILQLKTRLTEAWNAISGKSGDVLQKLREFIRQDVLAKMNPANWSVANTMKQGLEKAATTVKDTLKTIGDKLKFW